MPEHKDRFEAFMIRVKPTLRPAQKAEVAERIVPRFLRVEEYKEGQNFSITVPAVRRTWWWLGLFALVGMWLVFVPIIAVASVDASGYYVSINYSGFAFWIAALVAVSVIVWMLLFPRIRITADPQRITVHDRVYDWKTAQGFRIGYSVGGVERTDKQGGFSGFRMAYGPWGDDLPFLLPTYYAPAYVMFLNEALEGVQPRSAYEQAGETGIKPVLF